MNGLYENYLGKSVGKSRVGEYDLHPLGPDHPLNKDWPLDLSQTSKVLQLQLRVKLGKLKKKKNFYTKFKRTKISHS